MSSSNHNKELRQQSMALLNPTRTVSRAAGIPLRRRRRNTPSVRLGGKRRRVAAMARIVGKSVRLTWLRLRYFRMIKKLRGYYRNMIKDLAGAGAAVEAFQKRVLLEASFAVPVVGVSFVGAYP